MEVSNPNQLLREAVTSAIDRTDMITAVHALYGRLQKEIDQREPICAASGKCCHFESYGHRLYVTTLELVAFAADLQSSRPVAKPTLLPILAQTDGCALQKDGLCSVHAIRPFGCRIFFCDPSATNWQQENYERFHSELKKMHDAFSLPYFYVEWRLALIALNLG